MTNFDADILSELRDVREVAIRTDKHPRSAVVLCQEGARAPCCTRDEGGPFGAVL